MVVWRGRNDQLYEAHDEGDFLSGCAQETCFMSNPPTNNSNDANMKKDEPARQQGGGQQQGQLPPGKAQQGDTAVPASKPETDKDVSKR